jgi:hypothetical protein
LLDYLQGTPCELAVPPPQASPATGVEPAQPGQEEHEHYEEQVIRDVGGPRERVVPVIEGLRASQHAAQHRRQRALPNDDRPVCSHGFSFLPSASAVPRRAEPSGDDGTNLLPSRTRAFVHGDGVVLLLERLRSGLTLVNVVVELVVAALAGTLRCLARRPVRDAGARRTPGSGWPAIPPRG